MVNFKKLADRARDIVEQQGGPDALKEKAQRMKDAASRPGSMSDKAKAAAEVAKEKPNPAAPAAGDDMTGGPVGGGTAPPPAAADPSPVEDPGASQSETETPEVAPAPEAPAEPSETPPAPEPEDATPSDPAESSSSGGSEDR